MTSPSDTGPTPTTGHGPDSVVWRVNREAAVVLGWTPAILLQVAHPLVAAGVAAHSTFRSSRFARVHRLQQTLAAMLALTFGTDQDVRRAARGINAIHDLVHGQMVQAAGIFPAGTAYSAHDPELLRWVHATMLDVVPRAYELFVGPLSAEEKDRYCAETSGLAPLAGIPLEYMPTSMADLHAYMDRMYASGAIAVSETARDLARDLLYPPLPRLLHPLVLLGRVPALGLLPASIRQAYGFAWGARDDRTLRQMGVVARAAVPRFPSLLRHWPTARAAYRRAARASASPGETAALGPGGQRAPAGPLTD